MQLARVIGEVVATVKDANLTGRSSCFSPLTAPEKMWGGRW